jgi:hypothetical protein
MKKLTVFLTILVATTLVLSAAKPVPQATAEISLSCTDCSHTTPLIITGTGWAKRSLVNILVTGSGYANFNVTTDRRGSFEAIFTTTNYPSGSYTITASRGSASASANFTIE